MSIVLITLTFPPEPANQLHELLSNLNSQYSKETIVITSVPSYPTGKVYNGFKNKFSTTFSNGIQILRGPVFPSQSRNLFHRSLYYLSNFISSALILIFRKSEKDDIYIVYQPPISSFLALFIFSIFKKRKFVFWINDMWPETIIHYGLKNGTLIKGIELIYKFIYKRASKIIVLSPGFKSLLVESKGVNSDKIEIIYNWHHLNESTSNPIIVKNNRFTLTYAGNLGKFQDIATAIKAVKILVDLGYEIKFEIYGSGTEFDDLTLLVNTLKLNDYVFLHGRLEYTQVKDKLLNADALFVQLAENDLFSRTIPHKIYEYMGSSKPILAAISGDAANEILVANCGIVCQPNSIDSIVNGLIKMMSFSDIERANLGKNGWNFVKHNRNINIAAKQFNLILESI